MSKTLFTLALTYLGETSPLHFETYDALLAARGAIRGLNLEGLTVEEDEATRHLFITPGKAADYARLFVESLGYPPEAEAPRTGADGTEADPVLPSGLTHKEEVLHMLLRPSGVTLDQIMERFGILRDSASAIVSTTCSKFGYTSHRADNGVYTATKGRADGRGKKPPVHVLGRGRKVTETRAHH